MRRYRCENCLGFDANVADVEGLCCVKQPDVSVQRQCWCLKWQPVEPQPCEGCRWYVQGPPNRMHPDCFRETYIASHVHRELGCSYFFPVDFHAEESDPKPEPRESWKADARLRKAGEIIHGMQQIARDLKRAEAASGEEAKEEPEP